MAVADVGSATRDLGDLAHGEPRLIGGALLQGAVLSVPIVLLGVSGWAHRWTYDDGFIYYRVVHELVSGHGPVFNSGQRVEAFTSPLWVALLAFTDLVTPIRLEWLGVILGIACTLVGAGFATAGATRLARHDASDAFLVPAGLLVLVAFLPMWSWESGGLETGLVFAWLGVCLWILACWAETAALRISLWRVTVLGLGWLVRPELLLLSVVFTGLVVVAQWRADRWRDRVRLVGAAWGLPLAYEIFRMGYYGVVVANTAIAKEGSKLWVQQGWYYLQDFVRPYWLWIPVALLALGAYLPLAVRLYRTKRHRALLVLGTFFAAALLSSGSVIAYGGDYLHGRLLLPALFAFCAPVAVVPATKRYFLVIPVVLWALICGLLLRPPEVHNRGGYGPHFFTVPPHRAGQVTLDDIGWGAKDPVRRQLTDTGLYALHQFSKKFRPLALPPAPDIRLPAAAIFGVGASSYALGRSFYVLDLHGLADPLTAHLRLARRGWPGHEKTLPAAWAAATLTSADAAVRADDFPIPAVLTTPAGPAPFSVQLAYARRALQCPTIRDLRRSTTGSLSISRFLSNIVHSFSRTSVRVPSDPVTAYHTLCRQTRSALPHGSPDQATPPSNTTAIPLLSPSALADGTPPTELPTLRNQHFVVYRVAHIASSTRAPPPLGAANAEEVSAAHLTLAPCSLIR